MFDQKSSLDIMATKIIGIN